MDFYYILYGYMYTKLTWNNYEFVEQIKEDINPGQQISALTLLLNNIDPNCFRSIKNKF